MPKKPLSKRARDRERKRVHSDLYTSWVDDACAALDRADAQFAAAHPSTLNVATCTDVLERLEHLRKRVGDVTRAIEKHVAKAPPTFDLIDVLPLEMWELVWRALDAPARRAFAATCRYFANYGYSRWTRVMVPRGEEAFYFMHNSHRLGGEVWDTRFTRLRELHIGRTGVLLTAWHKLAAFWARRVSSEDAILLLDFGYDGDRVTLPKKACAALLAVHRCVMFPLAPPDGNYARIPGAEITWALAHLDARTTRCLAAPIHTTIPLPLANALERFVFLVRQPRHPAPRLADRQSATGAMVAAVTLPVGRGAMAANVAFPRIRHIVQYARDMWTGVEDDDILADLSAPLGE